MKNEKKKDRDVRGVSLFGTNQPIKYFQAVYIFRIS